MIKLVRLDERMIHGQVAIKWSRHLGVDRIIVISDEAAANDVVTKSLMMAAPATAKTAIKGLEDAITLLHNPKAVNHDILIIVSTLNDLLEVVNRVDGIPLINVGNYGRVASKINGERRKTYRKNLYAYDSEVEILKKIMASGIPCNYQTIPDDSGENLSKVLN